MQSNRAGGIQLRCGNWWSANCNQCRRGTIRSKCTGQPESRNFWGAKCESYPADNHRTITFTDNRPWSQNCPTEGIKDYCRSQISWSQFFDNPFYFKYSWLFKERDCNKRCIICLSRQYSESKASYKPRSGFCNRPTSDDWYDHWNWSCYRRDGLKWTSQQTGRIYKCYILPKHACWSR